MKTNLFIIFFLLLTIYCSYAQVPADSLTGTYAGQYWYANPTTSPWVITPDTFYVQNIDSINCLVVSYDPTHSGSYGGNYYTNYFSCNGVPPSNYYMQFYNEDSLKWIDDDVPQPPPNPHVSRRFYGKRISNHTSGFSDLAYNKQMQIYPNPCSEKLTIECKMLNEEVQIIIANMLGREIKKERLQMNEKTQVNISDIKEGVYFVRIQTVTRTFNKKVIIQR